MVPLLEIKTVPIEIQVKTTSATLEYSRGTAEMEVSRSESGNVDVRSRPIQLKLDTYQPSSQPPMPVVQQPSRSYEATSAYLNQGQLMLNARFGQQAAAIPSAGVGGETVAQTFPLSGGASAANTNLEGASMEIRYAMDKLNFDWKIDRGEFKFTPGDIEFSVEQMPSITIKYTGNPIYVPRSADPNYKPVDVQA